MSFISPHWLSGIVAALAIASATPAAFACPPDGKDGKGGKHGERMFDEVDADKDGAITEAEQSAFMKKKFEESDADKDGKVTKEEHKAAMKKHWEAKKQGKHDGAHDAKPDAAPKQ